MVETSGGGFRLSAYLRELRGTVAFPDGNVVELNEIGFTDDMDCKMALNTMVHSFWASGITDMEVIRGGVATLRLDYRISFTGHPSEEAEYFEVIVPVVRRSTVYGAW